jgi:hypothetical protein
VSIQAVGWVLEHSEATGNDRLVMISLANHADEERVCWPGVETICHEACVSRATAFRALDRLREQGEIHAVPLSGLTAKQRERYEKIRPDRRPVVYRMTGSHSETASNSGVSVDAPRGLTTIPDGVSRVRPEPSVKPSLEPSTSRLSVEKDPPPDWLKRRMIELCSTRGVSTDDAKRCIDRLRCENIADVTIDEAIGMALQREGTGDLRHPIGYVERVTRDWHAQRMGTPA